MKKYLRLTLILGILTNSCSANEIVGVYQTNFATYGMFGQSLTINCDGSFARNFQGDLMNDNSYGNWKIKEDTLVLVYDSVHYPKGRYNGESRLLIKHNKLTEYFPIYKKKYEELIKLIEKEGLADSIKIGSYSKFKRTVGKMPANFRGKMKRQYFEKKEKIKCKKL